MQITYSTDLYNYIAYIETVMTYESEAASSHLTNAYLDNADMVECDPSAADIRKTGITGFFDPWDRMKQS